MTTADEREFFLHASPVVSERRPAPPVESQWPAAPAPEAFFGLAGEMVASISEVSEADPVATLAHLLTAFGNAAGAAAHVRVMHDQHPARLFAVLVGDTSKGRKGSSWSEPRAIFERMDPAWMYRVRMGGLSSGEGLTYQVRDARAERQAVREKGRVVDYQEVVVDQGEDDKRLFVIEEEFSSVLTVCRREGNTLSAILRQACDRGDIAPLTKTNRISATGAHISIVGHVTRDELRARIDDIAMVNGFANRFIWLAVKRAKLLPWGGGLTDAQVDYFAGEIARALSFARAIGPVGFDEDAGQLWESIYAKLAEPQPGLLGAALARSEPQVLRLALTYALFDRSDVIRPEHLMAATALWEYSVASARWIFGEATGDPVTDTMVSALRQAGEAGLDTTTLAALFDRHVASARRTRALDDLISRGLVGVENEVTQGRTRKVYIWRGS